jgi:two-component system chemotaxis response regulator CheB
MIDGIAFARRVRVLVVDDSAFMRSQLSRMIETEPDFEVAGTASSGPEALAKIPRLDPDVVTLDIEMPGLDGLETLRSIMRRCPRPVIIMSAAAESGAETALNALRAGAIDYVRKNMPDTSLDVAHLHADLVAKIRVAAQSQLALTGHARRSIRSCTVESEDVIPFAPAIVAIGISTGGPQALEEILPLFPRELPVPILIVQHMQRGFTAPFARRLNGICSIEVHEGSHQEIIRPGVAYIAPAGMHMRLDRSSAGQMAIWLDSTKQDCPHVPCVDFLLHSVATYYRHLALGVIMTGMGHDGAEGMSAIYRHGGYTIGQDEESCVVYGMPRACAELGVLRRVVPLAQIPAQIMHAMRSRRHA